MKLSSLCKLQLGIYQLRRMGARRAIAERAFPLLSHPSKKALSLSLLSFLFADCTVEAARPKNIGTKFESSQLEKTHNTLLRNHYQVTSRKFGPFPICRRLLKEPQLIEVLLSHFSLVSSSIYNIYLIIKWNVTPLLVDFGGRVGI